MFFSTFRVLGGGGGGGEDLISAAHDNTWLSIILEDEPDIFHEFHCFEFKTSADNASNDKKSMKKMDNGNQNT